MSPSSKCGDTTPKICGTAPRNIKYEKMRYGFRKEKIPIAVRSKGVKVFFLGTYSLCPVKIFVRRRMCCFHESIWSGVNLIKYYNRGNRRKEGGEAYFIAKVVFQGGDEGGRVDFEDLIVHPVKGVKLF